MNQLIAIRSQAIGGQLVQAVNARNLHAFLQGGKDFSNWIKDRIEQYGFLENQDFTVFANPGEKTIEGGAQRRSTPSPSTWPKNCRWLSATRRESRLDSTS